LAKTGIKHIVRQASKRIATPAFIGPIEDSTQFGDTAQYPHARRVRSRNDMRV